MIKYAAIDFDGVICDSVDECHVTALAAWNRLRGRAAPFSAFDQIHDRAVRRFRDLRPYARNGAEFLALVRLTYENEGDISQSQYDSMLLACRDDLAEFGDLFYRCRNEFRQFDPEKWLQLHRKYHQFHEHWTALAKSVPIFIVTTKDRQSIEYICHAWELDVPGENLWTLENGTDKKQALLALAERCGAAPEQFLFLDDHPHHVQQVALTGALCFWARWGYTNVDQASKINEEIHQINALSELLRYL